MRLSIYSLWLLLITYFLILGWNGLNNPTNELSATLSQPLIFAEASPNSSDAQVDKIQAKNKLVSRALPKPKFFLIYSLFSFLIF